MSVPHLDFTGERMIPDANHGTGYYYEHLSRYVYVAQFCTGKRVLDVGCGSGYGSFIMANNGKAKKVTGLDVSKKSILYASERYPAKGLYFIDSDAANLKEIESDSIDIITCFDVLEYLENPGEFLNEAKRVLRRNGLVFVSTPNKQVHAAGIREYKQMYSPATLRRTLEKTFPQVQLVFQSFELAQIFKPEEKTSAFLLSEGYQSTNGSIHYQQGDLEKISNLFAVCSFEPSFSPVPMVLSSNRLDLFEFGKIADNLRDTLYTGEDRYQYLLNDRALFLLHLDRIRLSRFYKIWRRYVSVKESMQDFLGVRGEQGGIMSGILRVPGMQALISLGRKILPLIIRKRLRRWITKIERSSMRIFLEPSIDIKEEWSLWKENRQTGSCDVFIFGVIGYHYRHQRPQHLADQLLSLGHRVFYIENEFSSGEVIVQKIKPQLYTIRLPASEELFIYQDSPSVAQIETWKEACKLIIQEAEIINPVAKVDHPFWGPLIGILAMPNFYDCMDKHSGFKENSSEIIQLERQLFNSADWVVASSRLLQKEISQSTSNEVIFLPNAGDYAHFSQAGKKSTPKQGKKKIVGYFGAIADWFDVVLLEKMLNTFVDVEFQLIGAVDNPNVQKLEKKYTNLTLLFEQSYEALPSFLADFDVCIIPFVINDLIKATSPVKVYEYLAAGKPIVTTALPEIQYMKDVIYYSSTRKQFLDNVEKALNEKQSVEMKKNRQAVARSNTWRARGKVLQTVMKKHIFPKVSIVILSYNNTDLLKQCIESVVHRSFYPNLEIIVVDNNSEDITKKYLKTLKSYSQVKVIFNTENMGFARGNNIGMKSSTGEYIILLNNDTIVTPGWVSRLVFHVKQKNMGLVGPVTNSIGNEAKVDIGSYSPKQPTDLESAALVHTSKHWGDILYLPNLAAFCWILSRKVYEKVGGLDERFGVGMFEDDDYCYRVRQQNLRLACLDDVFVHHYGGQSLSKLPREQYKKLFEKNKLLYTKKWGVTWAPHRYRKQSL